MNEEPEEKSNRKGSIVALLLMLPVLYVLSIGPVYIVVIRTSIASKAVQWVYTPVFWLAEHSSQKPFAAYLEFWMRITHTTSP